MPETKKPLSEQGNWKAPLKGHPAAIVHVSTDTLAGWIEWAYKNNLDPKLDYTGHIFLYNISLETFAEEPFGRIWTQLYGYPPPWGLLNVLDSIHIIIPYHKETKTGRKLPNRLASWLNWGYTLGLIDDLSKDAARLSLAMSTMKRTWVSFVPVLDQTRGGLPALLRETEPTVQFEGEYSFGIYTALEEKLKVGQSLLGLLDQAFSKQTTPDAQVLKALEEFSDCVRLILAGGIDEPFTSRDGGLYQYDMLLSCASRDFLTEDQKATCALRAHVRVLSKLWKNRQSPLDIVGDDFFMNCPDALGNGELRMDAFLAWAEMAIRFRRSQGRWLIAGSRTDVSRYPFANSLRTYDDWRPAFSRPTDVESLLNRRELRLSRYAVFENQRYYRSDSGPNSPKATLEKNFRRYLEDSFASMKRGHRPAKPVLLILASSGSGKTELANSAGAFLEGKNLAKYKYKNVGKMSMEGISEIVNEAQNEAQADNTHALVALDEIHEVKNMEEFAKGYPIIDTSDRVFFILMTSFADGRFESFYNAFFGPELCPDDILSRSQAIELPPLTTEDELLILASSILKGAVTDTVNVEKRVLAYFLMERPDKRKNLGRTMRVTGEYLKNKDKVLRFPELHPLIPQTRWALQRFSGFAKCDLAKKLGDETILISTD